MIIIKKTSKLFDKKENDKKRNNTETNVEEALEEVLAASDLGDDEIWEPKTEEEIKQKTAILEIRKLLGQDTTTPITVSDIKKLEAEKLEAEKKEAEAAAVKTNKAVAVKDDGDEIWEPKTEEEKLQHASMLKIRELLGQDTSTPIKKSEVRKTETVNFVPPKPIVEEKVFENADNIWKPKTAEEKRQQAAILKIRELLGEDTSVPIKKQQQVKTQMVSSFGQQEEPVKRDPKVIIRCGDEKEENQETSSQYLLLKKLLEEDDKKSGAKKPEKEEKSEPAAVLPFGMGNAFTIGAIRNAEPTNKAPNSNGNFAQATPQQVKSPSNGLGAFNAEAKKVEPKKESEGNAKRAGEAQIKKQLDGRKIHTEEQEYIRPPEAANPNSPFFLFDFRELLK